MKTVFTDISTIAHIWANKTQDSARNGRNNLFFKGNTIYSYGYHFPIAKHVEHNGEKAVLFTERRYSNTTAKQIHVVRHACSHLNIIYCDTPHSTHEENFSHWISEAESVAHKLQSARKPELYLTELKQIQYRVEKYATFFGISIPERLPTLLATQNKQEYIEYINRKHALIEAEEKAKAAHEKRVYKKHLQDWLNGKGARMYDRLDGLDYLRLNNNGHTEYVETTQAVKIPWGIALELWQRVKSNTLEVGDTFMHYTVEEVGKTTRIGCHTFKTKYLIDFGNKIFNKATV